MKLSNWMIAKAIVEFVFGAGFVLFPGNLGSLFGMNLDAAGTSMAQLFGAMFIFGSIVMWSAHNQPASEPAVGGIIVAVIASNTLGFLVALFATLSGVWNALGWLPVALFLVFGLGFAYLRFARQAT